MYRFFLQKFFSRWDKTDSDLRVPSYPMPSKQVPPKVGSFDNFKHKPRRNSFLSIINVFMTKFNKLKYLRRDYFSNPR